MASEYQSMRRDQCQHHEQQWTVLFGDSSWNRGQLISFMCKYILGFAPSLALAIMKLVPSLTLALTSMNNQAKIKGKLKIRHAFVFQVPF